MPRRLSTLVHLISVIRDFFPKLTKLFQAATIFFVHKKPPALEMSLVVLPLPLYRRFLFSKMSDNIKKYFFLCHPLGPFLFSLLYITLLHSLPCESASQVVSRLMPPSDELRRILFQGLPFRQNDPGYAGSGNDRRHSQNRNRGSESGLKPRNFNCMNQFAVIY